MLSEVNRNFSSIQDDNNKFIGKVSKYDLDRQNIDFNDLRRQKERCRAEENSKVKNEKVNNELNKK